MGMERKKKNVPGSGSAQGGRVAMPAPLCAAPRVAIFRDEKKVWK